MIAEWRGSVRTSIGDLIGPPRGRLSRSAHRAVDVLARAGRPPPLFGDDDLLWPGAVERTVVVASEARSGSTLLCASLAATGLVGDPREYLQPFWLASGHRLFGAPVPTPHERLRRVARRVALRRQWWAMWRVVPSSLPDYLRELERRRTTPNGVFALKVHWHTYAPLRERTGFGFELLSQPISWVHIRRRDHVAQAVSQVRASQSWVWSVAASDSAPTTPVVSPPLVVDAERYDDDALVAAFHLVRDGTLQWQRFFAERGITPIEVAYEDLAADHEGTVGRVLGELGFSGVAVPAPSLRRQADEVSAQWADRFRRLHPDLAALVDDTA